MNNLQFGNSRRRNAVVEVGREIPILPGQPAQRQPPPVLMVGRPEDAAAAKEVAAARLLLEQAQERAIARFKEGVDRLWWKNLDELYEVKESTPMWIEWGINSPTYPRFMEEHDYEDRIESSSRYLMSSNGTNVHGKWEQCWCNDAQVDPNCPFTHPEGWQMRQHLVRELVLLPATTIVESDEYEPRLWRRGFIRIPVDKKLQTPAEGTMWAGPLTPKTKKECGEIPVETAMGIVKPIVRELCIYAKGDLPPIKKTEVRSETTNRPMCRTKSGWWILLMKGETLRQILAIEKAARKKEQEEREAFARKAAKWEAACDEGNFSYIVFCWESSYTNKRCGVDEKSPWTLRFGVTESLLPFHEETLGWRHNNGQYLQDKYSSPKVSATRDKNGDLVIEVTSWATRKETKKLEPGENDFHCWKIVLEKI